MGKVVYENDKLYVNGRAYVSTDNLALIRKVLNADNIYSTQIILNQCRVEPELLASLSGKYWMRAAIFDRVNQKDCTIKTDSVASL